MSAASKNTIYTIGHGTRSLSDFLDILKEYGIEKIIDIRTVPRSRHNPQFNKETLPGQLKKARIGYVHLKALGGLRHAQKESVNTAWKNKSFQGFADYMQTAQFVSGLARLIKAGNKKKVAIMCAESVPWHCHRSLVADALYAKHVGAYHIMSIGSAKKHRLTPWAKADNKGNLSYPG